MPDETHCGFDIIKREKVFRKPSVTGSNYPLLDELAAPHIESFNALFDDSGLPVGDGNGEGLLSLAIKDITHKTVFDGSGSVGEDGTSTWGRRMSSTHLFTKTLKTNSNCY